MATKRPDGRVEPGQRISSAFSARAWNRAQDAADVVLGARTGAMGDGPSLLRYCIKAPVEIEEATKDYPIGTAIKLTGFEGGPNNPQHMKGTIAQPRSLVGDERASIVFPEPFVVAVEPISEGQTAAVCAIAGFCYAKIRVISESYRYASLPTDRSAVDESEGEEGVLETSEAGYAIIVGFFGTGNDRFACIRL
jgi:hypothetical protein